MNILKKYPDEIIKCRWSEGTIARRKSFRCQHGHSGLTHPNCYVIENYIKEIKGCFDVETGNFNADFSIMLSWSIRCINTGHTVYDHITKKDLDSGQYDKRIIESCVSEMWKYTRLIMHYGKNNWFDLPFIRARYLWLKARGLYEGERFPQYGEMYVSDTYAMAKKLLKISSRRQDNIGKVVQGVDIKTRIDKDHWMAIKHGNNKQRQAAIDYIVDHNVKDVEQLEGNYLALVPFVKETRTSI